MSAKHFDSGRKQSNAVQATPRALQVSIMQIQQHGEGPRQTTNLMLTRLRPCPCRLKSTWVISIDVYRVGSDCLPCLCVCAHCYCLQPSQVSARGLHSEQILPCHESCLQLHKMCLLMCRQARRARVFCINGMCAVRLLAVSVVVNAMQKAVEPKHHSDLAVASAASKL